jgi:CDGSH-type Zn-finger protein
VTTTTTTSPSPAAGCCSSNKSKKDQEASFTTTNNVVTQSTTTIPIPIESVPLPNIPPPSSCCGPPSKNQQGQMIRVVTCRCGDSCACIGCDAHPSRAMKEGINDVYVGFDNANGNPPQQQRDNYQLSNIIGNNRRLSIAAICAANSSNSSSLPKLYTQQQQETDHPTSILSEDGVLLCGCGCSKTFEDCSDCFRELCQTYL